MVQANLLNEAVRLFEAQPSQGLATNDTTPDDVASVLEMLRNRLEEVVPLVFIRKLFMYFWSPPICFHSFY